MYEITKKIALMLGLALWLVALSGCEDNANSRTVTDAESTDGDSEINTDEDAESSPILNFYQYWEEAGPECASELLADYGGDFEALSSEQYGEILAGLDFTQDADLMCWGALAGLSIALIEGETYFYAFNAHLIADRGAENMTKDEIVALTDEYDQETNTYEIFDGDMEILPHVATPETFRSFEKTCGLSHNAGFEPDRPDFETLLQYMHLPEEIDYRDQLNNSIKALPYWFVRLLRGKGFFLSNSDGVSLSMGTPVSKESYNYYAGLMPGIIFMTDHPAELLAHEFCHVLDMSVIKGGYGNYRFPYQYPGMHQLAEERIELFGAGWPESPPDLPYGYISNYSRSSDFENMAEHCRAYVINKETFDAQATLEENEGHDLLRRKFQFMEALELASSPHEVLSVQWLQENDTACN